MVSQCVFTEASNKWTTSKKKKRKCLNQWFPPFPAHGPLSPYGDGQMPPFYVHDKVLL